jgi:hypothetical protein
MPESYIISLSWRKSSASASGDCVEVALSGESILVRDSKQNLPYILEFTSFEWREFVSSVHTGRFDREKLGISGARGLRSPGPAWDIMLNGIRDQPASWYPGESA